MRVGSFFSLCTAEALGFIPSEEDSVNWYQVSYGGLEVVSLGLSLRRPHGLEVWLLVVMEIILSVCN